MQPTLILALLSASLPLGGSRPFQQSPGQQVAPAEQDGQSALEEALRQAQEALATLPDAERDVLAKRLEDVSLQLQASAKSATEAERYRLITSGAPDALAQIEGELAKPPLEVSVVRPDDANLAVLESRAQQVEADLTAARQAVADLETEALTRSERRRSLTEAMAQLRAKEGELTGELATMGQPTTLSEEVHQLEVRARLFALQSELSAHGNEIDSYAARQDLMPKRRQMAQRQVAALEEELPAWRALVAGERETLAQDAVAAAEQLARETAAQHPLIVEIRDETDSLLGRERAAETGFAARQKHYEEERDRRRTQLFELRTSFESTRRKLELVGHSNEMGRVLREQYKNVYRPSAIEREISSLEQVWGETQYELLEVEERGEVVADVEARLVELVNAATGDQAPEDPAKFEEVARKALEARATQLTIAESYLSKIAEAQEDLLRDSRSQLVMSLTYRRFIEENVLYVRSTRIGPPKFGDLTDASGWLLSPAGWRKGALGVRSSFVASPTEPSILLLVLLALVASRRWARHRLGVHGEAASRFRTDTFGATARALALTLHLALPLPLTIWLLGVLLSGVEVPSGVTRCVGAACEDFARRLLFVLGLYAAARPHGLGRAHLRWSADGMESLRRTIAWSLPFVTVGGMLVHTLDAAEDERFGESLGRLVFIALHVLLTVVAYRVLWPGTPPLADYLRHNEGSLLARTHGLWSRGVVFLMGALALLSLFGYQYTARQFSDRVSDSLGLVLVLVLVRSLLTRWQFLARRKLAVEQARQRARARAEAAEAAAQGELESVAPTALDEDAVDIPAADAQIKRLFTGAAVTAFIVGIALIWSSVLPALSVLERVQIWPSVQILEEELASLPTPEATAEATPAPAAEPTPAPPVVPGPAALLAARATESELPVSVSVLDLIVAILILSVTWILARNLPGLLGMGVLRRLPVDAGTRYATTTILRYLIAVVGITAGMGAIGIGWSKVQWLAAALTFGLAFGLQEIFANFVSGIIILLERPVRVGDFVTIGGIEGQVSRLRMRSTTLVDWDRRELLVPNKNFITENLINWTLTDSITRVVIPVGIAYGSDVRLAQEKLLSVASACDLVLEDPRPTVVFREFGDSSLLLQLRAFIPSREIWADAMNRMHLGIDDAFREAEIEISFPQRDLHVRSADPRLAELFGGQEPGDPD